MNGKIVVNKSLLNPYCWGVALGEVSAKIPQVPPLTFEVFHLVPQERGFKSSPTNTVSCFTQAGQPQLEVMTLPAGN